MFFYKNKFIYVIIDNEKMVNMKKKLVLIGLIISIICLVASTTAFIILKNKENGSSGNIEDPEPEQELELPKPEITGGSRGELGIDKNINESNIDQYLNRKDAVYRDMRMLEDPANYENIGGDKFLSGYIDGFEVLPLPYIIPVLDLPKEVGDTYMGNTLFYDDNGQYIANYKESMSIIEKIFPKDKVIFLMCGGGGYAGMTKNFLISLGWDENKIYNIGGYWYYNGEHSIDIKKEINGKIVYDFDSVPYHEIDFDTLTKTSNYKEPYIRVSELKISTTKLDIEEGTSFQLHVIVLPNAATNKEVEWKSSNENIVSVSSDGLVKGVSAGEATITVSSIDNNKSITCKVTVSKRDENLHLQLDDVSKEIEEFNSYDIVKLYDNLRGFSYNPDGSRKEEYYDGYNLNELWQEEYNRRLSIIEQTLLDRAHIIDKLLDEKKTFIILLRQKVCDELDYYILGGAEKMLNENNYQYFLTATGDLDDGTLFKTKIDYESIHLGSVIIVSNGQVLASINQDTDAIKSDDDLKFWFNKYIDVR